MATCPYCQTSSRREPEAMWLQQSLEARPTVNAEQIEFAAVLITRLHCRCGWHVTGTVGGDGYFHANPTTEYVPPEE